MVYSQLIPVGTHSEVEYTVEETHTAVHIGSGSLRVLATPAMIGFMERTSHSMIARSLPEGSSSVGTLVEVRHLAPTPVGATVRITSRVLAVEGRKVTLEVEAWDGAEKVGDGRHERMIIDLQRFLKRVEEKAQAVK
jgi:predicted thioesterase